MAQITLSQSDIDDAELFLAEYLSEKVPEGDFNRGGALRDLAVKAFAYLYAYLRGEADRISVSQSIMLIEEELENLSEGGTLTGDPVDYAQMVDEVMSNWFVTRRGGSYSFVTGLLHFSERATVNITKDTKFWRTATLAFYIDAESDPYVIAGSSMLPQFDAKGTLIDYVVSVPLRAARADAAYDITPGRFYQVEAPGGIPYFSYAENKEEAEGGTGTEATEDLIVRARTAITVRNLINNRSCDATLLERFPDIETTFTVGMGEPEMIRDKKTEIARHIQLHTGGFYDTYVEIPLIRVEESGVVGGLYPRPDNVINVFRDPELTYDTATFTSLGVQAGHILFLRDGIIGVPRGFQIVRVTDHEIFVSEQTPFPEASDEMLDNEVRYSIGWFSPDFDQLDFDPGPGMVYERIAAYSTNPAYSHIPPGTSRRISESGVMVLSGRPKQDILSVEITDPDSADADLIDPSTGTLRFTNRVNGTPIAGSVLGTSEYQVEVINPEKGQSAEAVTFIRVGYLTQMDKFDGKNLKVAYQSLRDFNSIHDWIKGPDTRITSANHLLKARHPVWVTMTIPYKHKTTATRFLDESDAAQTVASFINQFDPNDNLDMSDIATQLRNEYDEIGSIPPFDIYYTLNSPDGQILEFKTTDVVSIFSLPSNGVTLENGPDIIVPDEMQEQGVTEIATDSELSNYYVLRGISDRTVVYRTRADLITFALLG